MSNNYEQMMKTPLQRVCLLGATGATGKKVSEYILIYTNLSLTLVGRKRERLEKLREELIKELAPLTIEERIEMCEIQLEDCLKQQPHHESIKNMLKGHDALINTIPPLDHHQDTLTLAELAIELGVDWIDPHMSPSTYRLLKQHLDVKAKEGSTTIVCQTGMYPGLASPLVREAAKHLPNISRATVAIMSREEGGMDMTSGIKDIVDYMKESNANVMIDSKWTSDSVMARKFNFPSVGNKLLSCYPLELEEMKCLNIPTLKNTGSYITEMGFIADLIMLGLQMSGKYMSFMTKPLSKLLPWSTGKVKAPFGSAIQVEAFDEEGNSFFLSLFHEHVYNLTAASIVSVLEQMMENRVDKKTNPGVHFAGMYVDPSKLIESCKQKGVCVENQQSSFHHFNK